MAVNEDNSERAEHIRNLNKVNEDVASLLQTAGTSVKCLTNDPTINLNTEPGPIEARKTAFRAATTDFFTFFVRIRDSLGAEADALENAKLIPAKPPPRTAMLREDEQGITNGGLGNFDVGWLNSRGDRVMRGKEKEVWAEARRALEALQSKRDVDKSEVTSEAD